MQNLGLEVLFKGKNMIRLLGGLWVALKISLISVAISIPLGILLGAMMTWKNPCLLYTSLSLATFIPLSISALKTSSDAVAGPIVHTIFVLLIK